MEEIKRELESIINRLFGVETSASVVMPTGQRMRGGKEVDFASNVAMKMAAKLGRPPRGIAEEILKEFSLEGFTAEIAGPGFLNFYSNSEYFMGKLTDLVENFEENIACDEYKGKTVVCEFSDPNPFKVLHVGHLYTSIVGDGIARLFEFAGANVVRANFGGDVGLHVAKTLYARRLLSEQISAAADANTSAAETAEMLAECYVEGTRAYEEDEGARAEITKLNREIYEINAKDLHDSELAEMYWAGREASYEYFKEFYARLGIAFDKYYPESTVAELGVKMVREHPKIYVESDGAIVFRGERCGLHTRVFINQEGLPTYETKDVGLLFTKWEDFKFDKSVVITGNEQKDYMAVVLRSVEFYAPELVKKTRHLTHGMVKLPGKVKMSSRLGNFLRAVDVINMVRGELGEESDERLAMAALKYAFLKYKMGGDIEFDAKSSVSVTGNSGIYLEYAVVRAKKILERLTSGGPVSHVERELIPEERALLKKMLQYKYVLAEAVEEMAPYKVCTYLYELAQAFSRFYENAKVVGSEYEEERGKMVKGYLAILEHGLKLLGIETVEGM